MSGGSTSTQTNSLSPWMEEAAKAQLGKATALTDTTQNPYKEYEGQRIAEFNPMQQQAFQSIQNMGTSGAIGQGIDVAGQAAGRALNTSYNPYQTGQFGAQAGQYMDPYMQNVVDIQQREAQRQADIARTQSNATAVKSGAFGGGRQAVVDAEAARNLAIQKGDIQARGLQDAYTRAQQQFNTEQALGEASRQYGANLGMKGLETALQGSSQLGGLGATQFGQQKDVIGLQQLAGTQQQTQEQAKLSQGYEDFLNKQKYPYQQLEFMSNIMRGTPYGSTTSVYNPGVSTGNQLLGAATMLGGAYLGSGGRFGFKEGGLASAYAAGGSVDSPESIQSIADNLSDAQLQQAASMAQARGDLEQLNVIQQEMASRAALRSGARTLPEEQGIGQLPAGDMNFADGGIIAFAGGGSPRVHPQAELIDFLKKMGITPEEFTQAPAKTQNQIKDMMRSTMSQPTNPPAARAAQAAKTAGSNLFRPVNPAGLAGYGLGLYHGELGEGEDAELARRRTMAPTVDGQSVASASAPNTLNRELLNQSEQTARKDPGVYGAPMPAGAEKPPVLRDNAGDTSGIGMPSGYSGLDVKRLTEQALAGISGKPHPFEKDIREVGDEKVKAKEAEAAGLEAIHSKFDDIYKGRKERQKVKEDDIKQMGTTNLGAAIFKLGAGIAAGKSLGAAAEMGTEQYMAGLDKINSAKEKLADARDRLEELEAQRGELTAREKLKLQNEIKTTLISAKEDRIKANMEMFKVNYDTALKMVDNQIRVGISQFEQQSQNARAKQGRSFDLNGEYARAVLAGDTTRAAKLKEVMNAIGEAKKPGLDMTKIKTFENLPGVKTELNTLSALRGASNPKPETLEKIRTLEQSLAAKARANDIDPAQIGLGGGTSSSGLDLAQWGNLTKN